MSPADRSVRAGRYAGPAGDETIYLLPRDMKAWEKAWGITAETLVDPEKGGKREVDMSPEAVAERARRKALHAEAMAFIASYTGTFGLILDIRANPKYGTKYLRLSERQVDAVLASRDRDLERAKAAAEAPRHPRYDEAIDQIARAGAFPNASDFIVSLALQVATGRPLSERQVDAVLRGVAATHWHHRCDILACNCGRCHVCHKEVPEHDAPVEARPAPTTVTEGIYVVDGEPWKAQLNREKTRLYAKRLVPDPDGGKGSWEYIPGGLAIIAARGSAMTVEQASSYGALHGICAVCGRALTNETSIERSIGPVCYARLAG